MTLPWGGRGVTLPAAQGIGGARSIPEHKSKRGAPCGVCAEQVLECVASGVFGGYLVPASVGRRVQRVFVCCNRLYQGRYLVGAEAPGCDGKRREYRQIVLGVD